MGELADICTACLCGDRNLSYIDTTDYYHLYLQILNEIHVYDVSQLCIRVCWECQALFRRFVTFKKQVKTSYNKLLVYAQEVNSKPCKNFSHLRTIQVTNISIPEVEIKEEPEELKQEIELDTHCEPEAFVNNLNMVALKKGKAIKKETIKKSKKKLKKQKSSIKCNIKVKQKKLSSEDVADVADVASNASADNTSDLELNTDYNVNDYDNIHNDMNGDIEVEVQAKVKLPNGDSKPPRAPPSKEVLPDKPQCAECGKKFSSRKTYRYHLNVLHKGQNRYPCPRCGKVYQWKSNLGRHMRSHKARDSGELYCETCDKRFSSVATYRQHMRAARSHVPESEFSFMCNECGKKFVNKTRLRDHIDWEHLKKIKFRCQLCNKPFKCHTSLYVHMQNVHKNKEKKDNLCHVCGKSYQNAAKLRYHIVAMHTSETPYQCEQCSAAFGWYSSLYRHVREVHYKMKVQAKKSKKSKKNEILPSLLPPQIILPPIHHTGPV